MVDKSEKFETWALLELFGHQRLAGKLSEQNISGNSFIRIDVPDVGKVKGYTRLFTAGAIYCITPVSEEIARRLADNFREQPVHPFELRGPERIGSIVKDDTPF